MVVTNGSLLFVAIRNFFCFQDETQFPLHWECTSGSWLHNHRLNNIVGEKAFAFAVLTSAVQLNGSQHRKYSKIYSVSLHFLQDLTMFGPDCCRLVTITYYTIVRRLTEPEPELEPPMSGHWSQEPGKTSGGQSEPTSSTKSHSKVFKRFNPAKISFCLNLNDCFNQGQ